MSNTYIRIQLRIRIICCRKEASKMITRIGRWTRNHDLLSNHYFFTCISIYIAPLKNLVFSLESYVGTLSLTYGSSQKVHMEAISAPRCTLRLYPCLSTELEIMQRCALQKKTAHPLVWSRSKIMHAYASSLSANAPRKWGLLIFLTKPDSSHIILKFSFEGVSKSPSYSHHHPWWKDRTTSKWMYVFLRSGVYLLLTLRKSEKGGGAISTTAEKVKFLPESYYASYLSDRARSQRPSPSEYLYSMPYAAFHSKCSWWLNWSFLVRSLLPLEDKPNVISLLAGKPNASMFPFTSISFTAKSPTDPSKLSTYDLSGSNLEEALQYGPTAGMPRLLEWFSGLQTYAHGRKKDEGWRTSVGIGSQDVLFKVRANAVCIWAMNSTSERYS